MSEYSMTVGILAVSQFHQRLLAMSAMNAPAQWHYKDVAGHSAIKGRTLRPAQGMDRIDIHVDTGVCSRLATLLMAAVAG
ncbi:MAG: hypothetical protein R2856_38345 [Caldilineaceae bacterium]